MKNKITFEARRFPVVIIDEHSGEERQDFIVLSKQQLQAAQMVGESSKELITRIYSRNDCTVKSIGKAEKKALCVELAALWEVE